MRATARKVWPASLVAISLLGLSGVPASAQLFDPEYSGNLLASGACADCFLTADLAVNGPLSQYLSGPAPNEIQIDSYEVVNMTISDNGGQSASIATPSDQRNIWFVLYAFLNPAHTTIEFSRGWDLLVMWDGGNDQISTGYAGTSFAGEWATEDFAYSAGVALSSNLDDPGTWAIKQAAIPEVSTWAMMALGLAGLGVMRQRAPRKSAA